MPLRYPTQYDSGYFLDDLKAISFAAIVRPTGSPRIERRDQRCGADPSPSYAVTVQPVELVAGSPGTPHAFDVVAPLYDAQGPYVPDRLLPLSAGNYLLLGAVRKDGRLAMSLGMFETPSLRPTPNELHQVTAKATDIAGWTLVRTDASGLPRTNSVEELALRALVQALDAQATPGFGALDVFSRLTPYSLKTATVRTSAAFRKTIKEDRIGDTPANFFLATVLIPAMRAESLDHAGKAKEPYLQTLSRWNDRAAQTELDQMHTPPASREP